MAADAWPSLELAAWQGSAATFQLWLQVIGKIRLAQTPWVNHAWHVPLYVTARGLTTSPIPHGRRAFQIDLDLTTHQLRIEVSSGDTRILPLRAQPVADFYAALMNALQALDLPVQISEMPSEIPDAVPFSLDTRHAEYDADAVWRYWQALLQVDRVFRRFRAAFVGKVSPVHLFWGGLDLAVTRFSGRTAPRHPGGVPHLPDWVARDAYSHEVSSAGFWPGGPPHPFSLFYSYAYPEPPGYAEAAVPAPAFYSEALHEFVLPYDAVRTAPDPDAVLLAFLQATYAAAADLGGWDRAALERPATPGPNLS